MLEDLDIRPELDGGKGFTGALWQVKRIGVPVATVFFHCLYLVCPKTELFDPWTFSIGGRHLYTRMHFLFSF